MADLVWDPSPERPSLRRAIRHRLRELNRPCRVAAEDFMAAESRIDLLGVGSEGEIVSIRICGGDDDALQLSRCMSDLVWLAPRIADLAKLGPHLEIEASAEPRALLFSPDFREETRLAAAALAEGAIELVTYRCYRDRGQLGVLVSNVGAAAPDATGGNLQEVSPAGDAGIDSVDPPSPPPPPVRTPAPASVRLPRKHQPSQPNLDIASAVGDFRTGLSDVDLHPSPGELIDVD